MKTRSMALASMASILEEQPLDHCKSAARDDNIQWHQKMWEDTSAYMRDCCDKDPDDYLFQTGTSFVAALASKIRQSSQSRGPPIFSSRTSPPGEHVVSVEELKRREDALLQGSWSDGHPLSGPAKLPDDFDDTEQTQVDSSFGSEHAGPSMLSRTVVSGQADTTHVHSLPKGKEGPASSVFVATTHAGSVTSDQARLKNTSPQPQQHDQRSTHVGAGIGLREDIPRPRSDSSRRSWHSRLYDKACCHNSLILGAILVLLVLAAETCLLWESTRIKITNSDRDERLLRIIEFVLGILHNVAPLAYVIANIWHDRRRIRAMGVDYLVWLVAMLIVSGGTWVASIALQTSGKQVFAMMVIGISDIWFVFITSYLFTLLYFQRPQENGR